MSIRECRNTSNSRCWMFKMPYTDENGEKMFYVSEKFKTQEEAREAEHLFLESLMENKIKKNDLKAGD